MMVLVQTQLGFTVECLASSLHELYWRVSSFSTTCAFLFSLSALSIFVFLYLLLNIFIMSLSKFLVKIFTGPDSCFCHQLFLVPGSGLQGTGAYISTRCAWITPSLTNGFPPRKEPHVGHVWLAKIFCGC